MKERFKTITDYPDYLISTLGRILSFKHGKEHELKQGLTKGGYYVVSLLKDGVQKTFNVHSLMVITFLNHKPNKFTLVVNHINHDRSDNNLANLEVITNRENTNQKHLKSSSKYTGVTKLKKCNSWQSCIVVNGKKEYLGSFKTELEASAAYENELGYNSQK